MAEPSVVNSSPFIVLAMSGWLDLLRQDGERIIVPRQVQQEVLARFPSDAAADAMRTASWVDIVEVGEPPNRLQVFRLDAGEEAVLTWALHHPGTVAILDDRRGRRAALALGIRFSGTLGLVLDAKRCGRIPAARPVLAEILRVTQWRLSVSLIEAALAEIGE